MVTGRFTVAALAAVFLATFVVACRSDKKQSATACPATLSAATRLTYEASADAAGAVPVLCERLKALRVAHAVRSSGANRVVIEVPKTLPSRVTLTDVKNVARPGRLAIYDWEVSVIGPDGKPAPDDPAVTGGPSAGDVGAPALYDAILRASRRPASASADGARRTSLFYAVDPRAEEVYRSSADSSRPVAADTRAAALADVPAAQRDTAKVHEVKPGTVILRAEQFTGGRLDNWYVLKDDVALEGTEIVNPQQAFDEGPGASGQPIVTFEFTTKGQRVWQDVTRRIAQRGAANVALLPGQDPAGANQHFAIVLDDEIVSTPFIDFRQNPDGIDGSAGSQIQGGFTVTSARSLASTLRTGALAADLRLISAADSGAP